MFGRRSFAFMLARQRRWDEALAQIRTALEIDPLSADLHLSLGTLFLLQGQSDAAEAEYMRSLELDPALNVHAFLAQIYCRRGSIGQGLAALEEAKRLSGDAWFLTPALATCYAEPGREAEARALLATFEDLSRSRYVSPLVPASLHLALGEYDAALADLERAVEERDLLIALVTADSSWDPVRTDPRFVGVMKRMGLPGS